MRCEDVRRALMQQDSAAELSSAVHAHLRGCGGCQRLAQLHAQIDDTLDRGPVWTAPDGFALRVVGQARPLPPQPLVVDVPSIAGLGGTMSALATGGIAFVGAEILREWLLSGSVAAALDAYDRVLGGVSTMLMADASGIAWTCAALSLLFSAWYYRSPVFAD